MRTKTVRVQRVERELHQLVALYLQHEIPETIPALAAVTAVDMTGDMRKARVYVRLVGPAAEVETAQKVLGGHRQRMQRKVATDLRLKFCPVLEFRFGQAVDEQTAEVDRLLAQLGRRKSPWE